MKKLLLLLFVIFYFQGFSQVVLIGDASTYSAQYVYYYPNGWWAGIYDQSELGISGDIYSITVLPDIISDHYESYNYQKIYIGHLSETEFSTNDIPDVASMTLVYSGGISFYDQTDLTIEFSQPFSYNNSDNLIVYWENKDGDYQRSIRFTATDATNKYLASYAHTFQDTAIDILSNRPDIQLNFAKQYDIRPKELVLPMTDGDLTNSELVRLYVENMGSEIINSFDIKYSLDSGQTWSSGSFSGTLNPFQSGLFTFPTVADMSVEKTYKIMIVTELGIDELTSNDTLYTEITHYIEGTKCSDPIELTDPVENLEGNTILTGNHYGYNSSYCVPNGVGGNDAIYSFTLTEDTYISLRMNADRNEQVTLHLLDGCPESAFTCLQYGGGTSDYAILGKKLTPGTYYVLASNWGASGEYYFWMDWDWTQDTDIESFDVGTSVSSDIDKLNHTIDIVVSNGTDISSLTPTFGIPSGSSLYISAALQTSGATIVDFTSPVTYTVNSSGDVYTQDWTVTITVDPNTAPTDISLDNNHIDENQASDVVIGNLSSSDGTPSTYTYSLVSGTGDTDNASFQIENDVLKANAIFDFETKDTFEIRIQTSESVYSYQKSFEIIVDNTNENPIGLNLSNNTVSELAEIGTVVGIFTTDDQEGGDYVYDLILGSGSTHNSSFYVDEDSLKTNVLLDAETLATMYVRVNTTDTGGLDYSTSFTITVSEEDEPPTDIVLSKSSLYENNPINTLVGTLTSSDPENGDFIYSLVAGVGDDDNSSFSIVTNNLLAQETFDKETKDTYLIRIETEDETGLTYSESFTITIDNLNEAPDSIYLSNYTIDENSPLYTEIGLIYAEDPDDDSGFLFGLSAGEGGDDNSKFLVISGNRLINNANIDFEQDDTLNVRLRVYDPSFQIHYEQVKIIVINKNESPTGITLSNNSVDENKTIGTGFAKLSGDDPEGGDYTFAFASGTGDADNSSFTIDGDSLRTNAIFDYESDDYYQIRLSVTDTGGLSYENYFTINIDDVFENTAPYGIDLNYGWVYENSPIGSGVGKFITHDITTTTYSYELVSGDGDDHNNLFYLDVDSLRTNSDFDYETQSEYSIRVKSSENGAESFERIMSVMIFNAFEAPDAINISNDSIPEDIGQYEMIGGFYAEGEDAYYSFDFEFISGDGDVDNDKFYTNAGYLYTFSSYDYNTQNTFSIRIRAYDYDGHSYEQIFTIYLTEVNEAPIGISLSNEYVMENEAVGSFIGEFSTTDYDDDSHVYTFESGYDESYFAISGDQLLSNYEFDYETQSSYYLVVRSTDPAGEFVINNFYIYIDDDYEESTGIDDLEIATSKIYPNPTSGISYLLIENSYVGNINISIYDVAGLKRIEIKKNKLNENFNTKLDIEKLPSGFYNIIISYEDKMERLTIIKQ